VHLTGPSLAGLLERPAGAAEGFERYSGDLRKADFHWEPGSLDAFLADPKAMFPGTYMTFPGIDHPAARADLVAFLTAATAPGGAEEMVEHGIIPEGLARGQVPPPLADAPPEARIAAIRHCGDSFFVQTEAGAEIPVWEKNVRIKIDSAETGPPAGVPVLLGAGMQGDRVSVIFGSIEEMRRFLAEKC
jgi:cytochrome c